MKYSFTLLLPLLLLGCTSTKNSSFENQTFFAAHNRPFTLSKAVFPPPEIQSLQLHPEGNRFAPPIIRLNGSKKLVLAFDHLSKEARQFKIHITHYSQSWAKSPLSPTAYTAAFFETYFGGGVASFTNTPSYRHYEYRFPNERLDLTKSGNYLLSVFEAESDKLLFRIPFFITENKGKLQTRTQTVFANQKNVSSALQLFSSYRFPSFVTQPQFDLSISYVPSQFWGRARTVNNGFYAGRGLIEFRLPQNKAFAQNYSFNLIDLRAFPPAGSEVADFIAGETPARVVLKIDMQPFSTFAAFSNATVLGPLHDRQSQYYSVRFRFEPASDISPSAELYVIGNFNNWSIKDRYRMRLDVSDSLWKGSALMKQGVYAYKYILLENGRIKSVSSHESFNDQARYYLAFVYYRDPELHYDRLLKVERINLRF